VSDSRGDREELARRQAELVASLAGMAEVPAGFDGGQVALCARTLLNKRRAAVAKTWPAMGRELGRRFRDLFDEYARASALPESGPVEDGRAFAEHLLRTGGLGDGGRTELALHRVARGWPVRVMRLPGGRSLLVAVRGLWGRVRTWRIPLW
jgi:hypothetical protein